MYGKPPLLSSSGCAVRLDSLGRGTQSSLSSSDLIALRHQLEREMQVACVMSSRLASVPTAEEPLGVTPFKLTTFTVLVRSLVGRTSINGRSRSCMSVLPTCSSCASDVMTQRPTRNDMIWTLLAHYERRLSLSGSQIPLPLSKRISSLTQDYRVLTPKNVGIVTAPFV